MIKDFGKSVVLTTKNPEAFINYRYDSGDPSTKFYIRHTDNTLNGKLFINGMDISTFVSDPSHCIYLSNTGDPSIASFHIFTKELNDFDYNLHIDYSTGSFNTTDDVSILNRKTIYNNKLNIYETTNTQLENETSYLILRTNPKFTGNIKLVIDNSNNLFLDTFKVSDILNNKRYRKQPVSSNSVLSGDIRKTFSTLPLGEIYKVGIDDTLNISLPKTNIYEQYNMTYSYGARLLEDELYEDDYSLLAPLWINSKLPDYFAIFRIDGVYNEESNGGDVSGLADKFLTNGCIIKSWSIKENTILGNYLKNHLNELSTIRTPIFLSMSDLDLKDPDPNTTYGISIDKGIITGRSETPYFFNQKINSFTDINAFVSLGFERQNLLCPNLINLEYAFNDNDASLYKMYRYYGLYLTDNELYNISYYKNEPDASIQILSLDGLDSSSFINSTIFDSSGYFITSYKNRIFTINDINKIKRITNVQQINGCCDSLINEWVNKTSDNIFSTKVTQKYFNKFITFNIENLLNQGEHLRIIDKTQYKIWEIVGVDSTLLEIEKSWPYATIDTSIYTVYKTVFSTKGNKENQIKAIKNAFDTFNNYSGTIFETTVYKTSNNQLSIKLLDGYNNNDVWFQRLTSQTLNIPYDPSSGFNSSANYNDIHFYGSFIPTIDEFEQLSAYSIYGPYGYELYGDRMSIQVQFLDTKDYNVYSYDSSVNNLFYIYTMYMGTDNWYRLIEPIDISTSINTKSYQYINDPHELEDKSLILTSNQIKTVRGYWNAYKPYPLTISLMGVNPVKDFDFTVYDNSIGFKSEYFYKREDDSSTYYLEIQEDSSIIITERNSYTILSGSGNIIMNSDNSTYDSSINHNVFFNTFDSSAYLIATSNTLLTTCNLNGTKTYTSYDVSTEEDVSAYYLIPNIKLKYGLTLPYVTKWVSIGYDCRNNPLRLMLNVNNYDNSSNFIPYDTFFYDEISFPSFKYLSPGDNAWKSYIYLDINDIISYDGSLNTIKELMINNPYIDFFSKFIYYNNTNNNYNKSTFLYYNEYKNNLETIINGLNFNITVNDNNKNIFNVKDWNKYKFSFISTTSRNSTNNHPLEIFINENTKTFLLVWYQGTETLNYNKRYSTYFEGKNLLYDYSTVRNFCSFKHNDKYWSYIKTPFIVNFSALSPYIINIFDASTSYSSNICSPFNQFNYGVDIENYSILNAYAGNNVTTYSFNFNKSYNTFNNAIDYVYNKSTQTYGSNIINYANTYMNNTNIYSNTVCNLDLLKILLLNGDISYYIFRETQLYTNNNFTSSPLTIIINNPTYFNGLYTYNGWYTPKFNQILNFNYNEEHTLINILKKDFIYGNTHLISFNNIPQMWYNKIVNKITDYDISIGNAIKYYDGFNIFSSQWDYNYYTIDNSTLIDGVNSSFEIPSFFGSKLIKLPYSLTLDSWDITTAKIINIQKTYQVISFNITRKIINMFKNNNFFISNWDNLIVTDSIINNYIINTILNYYNINENKISVYTYNKNTDGNIISYTLDDNFILDIQSNINSNLLYENGEYLYNITIPTTNNLTWFFKIVLFEK